MSLKNGLLVNQGILREENGYYIVRQSMPYPLAENNAFLVEQSSGWSVIDVGIELPRTHQVWEQVFQEVGILPRQVKAIYITHCHPDHLGAARWLQEQTEASVYMLEEEITRACRFVFLDEKYFASLYQREIEPAFVTNGFSPLLLEKLVKDWHLEVSPRYPRPRDIQPLRSGETLDLQGKAFEIIPAPGHADGQFLLWNSQLGHLFCADLVVAGSYLHFTDWPNSFLDDPLASFFSVSEQLQSLGVQKVFPGHGATFTNLAERLQRLTRRHHKFMTQVEDLVKQPLLANDLYPLLVPVFGFNMEEIEYIHLHRVLMGELLGYLNHLVTQQRLLRWKDTDRTYYAPAKA